MSEAGGAVIVFARSAVPGQVKTRLVPPLSESQAAAFHLAALDDVVAMVRRAVAGPPEIFVSGGPGGEEEMRRRYPDCALRRQRGRDLGARLAHAFEDAFERGHDRALVLGSDHPTLPAEYLAGAPDRLDEAEAVLGPSRDGGYYLVGLHRRAWPRAAAAFRGIPWSTPMALERTLVGMEEAGLAVTLLPEWYDVDRPDDLQRLRRDVRPDSNVAAFLAELER